MASSAGTRIGRLRSLNRRNQVVQRAASEVTASRVEPKYHRIRTESTVIARGCVLEGKNPPLVPASGEKGVAALLTMREIDADNRCASNAVQAKEWRCFSVFTCPLAGCPSVRVACFQAQLRQS